MQLGLHLIVRKDLGRLAEQGAEVSAPYLGVVDLVRAVEGNLPEPPPSMPLGLVGLDALCLASGSSGVIGRRTHVCDELVLDGPDRLVRCVCCVCGG